MTSNVSFLCASHMCPNQYATGLTDGFYMCAIMMLCGSFIEQMVNHVRFRITYTVEKEEEEPIQDVEELVEEPIQDVEEPREDQPIELEKDESIPGEIPHHT